MNHSKYRDILDEIRLIERRLGKLHQDLYALVSEESSASEVQTSPVEETKITKHENQICDFVDSIAFKEIRISKKRFMSLLQYVLKHKRDALSRILNVQGRSRLYFATSEKEIRTSGKSTFPEEITGTGIYVTTNLSNDRKINIIESVLREFGEDREFAREASKRIDPANDIYPLILPSTAPEVDELQI
jgi:negative modulator of initiation of replication